jgi:hypothetical protein
MVRTWAMAMRFPTPSPVLRSAVSGHVSLAILAIRRSYSCTRSLSDSTSRSNSSKASCNPALDAFVLCRRTCAVTLAQPFAVGFHQPSCGIHQGRFRAHQFRSCTDLRQLGLGSAMLHWARINARARKQEREKRRTERGGRSPAAQWCGRSPR